MLRSLLYISLGLAAGQLLEGLGLNARIGKIASPLMGRAHLPSESGAAFAAAFVSGVTANTLLFTSWREGKLSRGQLVVSNLINISLPAYFLHAPSTFFVVLALLGTPGLYYFAITLTAALVRFFLAVSAGGLFLPRVEGLAPDPPAGRKPWPEVWQATRTKLIARLGRMLWIIVPVYLMVYLLSQGGAFKALADYLAQWFSASFLSLEALSVVVFSVMAEAASGYAAAAALLESGGLEVKQVVIALLIGNLVAAPVRVLRHQLPYYLGIFTPGLGGLLIVLGQSFRIASLAVVTWAYAVFF